MKLLAKIVLAMMLGGLPPAFAQKAPPSVVPSPAAPTKAAPGTLPEPVKAAPSEADLLSHRHYINKAGYEVHSPAKSKDGSVPAGASAQCRDGSYSFSMSRRGTCSHHGGVASWL